MKRILLILCAALLHFAPKAFADGVPPEVILYAAQQDPSYQIEDYYSFWDTPTVPYGFALLRSPEERRLAIFTADSDGWMHIWQSTAGAVPQHPNTARFSVPEKGQVLVDPVDGRGMICDGLRFSICIQDDWEEDVQASVTYQFEETGFEMVAYQPDAEMQCLLREGCLEFYSHAEGFQERIEGTLEREITRVVFADLPRTAEEAAEKVFGSEIPISVVRSVDWYFPDFRIADYTQISQNGETYGLVLMSREEKHMLIICRIQEDQEVDLLYATQATLPQGAGKVYFCESDQQEGISLALAQSRENGPINAAVTFGWEKGAFRLISYLDARTGEQVTRIDDETLIFGNEAVHVSMLSDIRYVDFDALPKTADDAKEKPDIVPAIPMAAHPHRRELTAQVLPMIEGRNHKVHVGPGEQYARSGGGKGTVSTNSWVQVFGREKGWLMIQYHIGGDRYRIGWIKEPALKKGVTAPLLSFYQDEQEVTQTCALTDDPMGSGTPILMLEPGTIVQKLIWLGELWEYVEVEVDGEVYRGFVSSDCLTHG